MFTQCVCHLRIRVSEELTRAVLIHALANRNRPLAPVSSVAAVLSRVSYRFLNPPHKAEGLRALTRLVRSVCHAGVVEREIAVSSLASARGLKRA